MYLKPCLNACAFRNQMSGTAMNRLRHPGGGVWGNDRSVVVDTLSLKCLRDSGHIWIPLSDDG